MFRFLLQQQSQQKPSSEKSRSKKGKEPKPRVKKLKYHQYVPPDQKQEASEAPMDSSYARLLQQQQLFLQLQILSQQQQHYNYQTILPAPLKYVCKTLQPQTMITPTLHKNVIIFLHTQVKSLDTPHHSLDWQGVSKQNIQSFMDLCFQAFFTTAVSSVNELGLPPWLLIWKCLRASQILLFRGAISDFPITTQHVIILITNRMSSHQLLFS